MTSRLTPPTHIRSLGLRTEPVFGRERLRGREHVHVHVVVHGPT